MALSRVRYSVSEAGTPGARSWAMKPANISARPSLERVASGPPLHPAGGRGGRRSGRGGTWWAARLASRLPPAVEEGQALEEMDVLLVLEERAMERRDHHF